MKTLSKKVSGLIALALLLTCLTFLPGRLNRADELEEAEQKIAELERKKSELAEQKKDQQSSLSELQQKKSESEENISWLEDRSKEQQEVYHQLMQRRKTLLSMQQAALTNLENAKQRFEEKKEQYGERVEAMFRMQHKSSLELLLEADSLEGFFTSIKFMRIITDNDEAALEDLQADHKQLMILADETAKIVEENQNEVDQIEDILAEIRSDIDFETEKLAHFNISIDQINDQIDTYAAMESEVQDALKQAENNKKAIQAKLAAQKNGSAPFVPYSGGKFAWPLPASHAISSYFGPRTFELNGAPYSDFHTGLDITAPVGTPYVAAAPGVVTFASTMSVGGNAVIIDHGGGIQTLGCHLSGFACAVGDQVAAGQTVGYVGMTGFTTGPHLHFEVRVNGNSVDPIPYL